MTEEQFETEKVWLENTFKYHAPNENDIQSYQHIRDAAKDLVRVILFHCPPCADRTAAIRKIREATMTANASIALRGSV